MSDVADILGFGAKPPPPTSAAEEASRFILNSKNKPDAKKSSAKKPKGMKREVYDLVGVNGLVPAVQSNQMAPSFKSKRVIGFKGKWAYAPIESSARSDQLSLSHWILADICYNDYPYAKYNIKIENVSYTDEEYNTYLVDETWSREDTDQLVELCYTYDLRWSVISDRAHFSTKKTVEQMQARFNFVTTRLNYKESYETNPLVKKSIEEFNQRLEKDTKRRAAYDDLYQRTPEDESAAQKLKEEIKHLDTQLRKVKKQVKAESKAEAKEAKAEAKAAAAATSSSSGSNAAVTATNTEYAFPKELAEYTNPVTVDKLEIIKATTINQCSAVEYLPSKPGQPALQSSRMYLVDNSLGVDLSKSIVTKMHSYLQELHIPERPVATKRVCDLVDIVRKETLALISLHNIIKKKEKDLTTLKAEPVTAATKGTGATKGAPKAPKAPKAEKSTAPKAPKAPKVKKEASTAAASTAIASAAAASGTAATVSVKAEGGSSLLNEISMHDSFELNLHDDHDLDLLDVFDANEFVGDPVVDTAVSVPTTTATSGSTKRKSDGMIRSDSASNIAGQPTTKKSRK